MSASFNKVMLMGNLTRDPQVKQLPSNTTLVEFGLAVSRKFKTASGEDREDVAFVDCSAFGRQAETISQFCTKGKPLFVEGRLKYDTWDDKSGGGKRSKLSVVVENFQFLPTPNRDPDVGGAERPASRPGREEQRGRAGLPDREPVSRGNPRGASSRPAPAQPFGDEQQFADADIPFIWEGRRQDPV